MIYGVVWIIGIRLVLFFFLDNSNSTLKLLLILQVGIL